MKTTLLTSLLTITCILTACDRGDMTFVDESAFRNGNESESDADDSAQQPCLSDSECFVGEACVKESGSPFGVCVSTQIPCDWNDGNSVLDCDNGMYCTHSGTCVMCEVDEECGEGMSCTELGLCVESCESDAQCGSDLICDLGSGACVPEVTTTGGVNDETTTGGETDETITGGELTETGGETL